jgi:hypothetical protein
VLAFVVFGSWLDHADLDEPVVVVVSFVFGFVDVASEMVVVAGFEEFQAYFAVALVVQPVALVVRDLEMGWTDLVVQAEVV